MWPVQQERENKVGKTYDGWKSSKGILLSIILYELTSTQLEELLAEEDGEYWSI